ncbi:MAG TPA: TRC40/GET3/ArsA family transport-energizing ATPase [Solirubrobacteraceae bacterium]|nr:TRC40/GET3/ArsA family transport-energizing ATPase [Solirubrobacteraceae bacterium]
MTPRTILYTGKGGVGKTSVAAATARACAAAGLRTLAISTDPAHSLSESLEVELGPDPRPAGPQLWGQQVSAQEEIERHWSGVQAWLGDLFLARGLDHISAHELTVPPGTDELFSLLRLKGAHESGEWQVIVVDCAPTGETLRLLSFPDVARWWIEKVFPFEGQILAAAGPIARSLLDIPIPTHAVFADIKRLSENLIAMNEILRDREHASVRLVMNPEKMVIGEAMRTFTYLNLYGYLTDAVIVNRVFPSEVGAYFETWRLLQQQHLELVSSAFAPVPVLRAPFFDQEVVGGEMLDRLAIALFAEAGLDPAAVLHEGVTQELEVSASDARLRLPLPLAQKGEITLKKAGLELIVGAGGQKRTISLPPALAGFEPMGAKFEDGALEVRFNGQRAAGRRP